MGIKGLNQLLKKCCAGYVKSIPAATYSGKRIAVDASIFVYQFKYRPNFVESLVELVVFLRERDIEPLFVFDGRSPIEKKAERMLRASKREVQYIRIENLEAALKEFSVSKTISPELQELYDRKIRKDYPLLKKGFHFKSVSEYVKNLRSQMVNVTTADYDKLKTILGFFSIPFIVAEGEGEILCANLARRGVVDAVFTKDTDALACRAPVVLTRIEGDRFDEIRLSEVLTTLDMSPESWTDLCIMCGTDFNPNIARIGPMNAMALIKKYETLEAIAEVKDVEPLNFERTRQIFMEECSFSDDSFPPCGEPKFDEFAEWVRNGRYKISIEKTRQRLEKQPSSVNAI